MRHKDIALTLRASFFVCIPGVVVATLWTYKAEMAHAEHTEHIK